MAAVAVGEVHALGLREDLVPAKTGFADGWGVDERGQFLRRS
jgi:hypothetical protein